MINSNQPHQWKEDTRASVDLYNDWFMRFAPEAFRESRINATRIVEKAFTNTDYLRDITTLSLRTNPSMLPVLRMSTCPPLAFDRLMGLADVSKSTIDQMEKKGTISRLTTDVQLARIVSIIDRLLDRDIFPWLSASSDPAQEDAHRAATIVADRYCGALTNPIIRNAQEQRQLAMIQTWLEARGYTKLPSTQGVNMRNMPAGTFSFRMNIPVHQGSASVNIPVDAVIQPLSAAPGEFPILIEAKSAGDFTNVNKRRKEEAQKFTQLKHTFGDSVRFVMFLCGYFDGGYLGYSAAEGLDWVWEHRVNDLEKLGL